MVPKQFLALMAFGLLALMFLPAASAANEVLEFTAKEANSGCAAGKTFCFATTATEVDAGETYTFKIINPSTNGNPHNLCIKVDSATAKCAPGPTEANLSDPGQSGTVDVLIPAGAKSVTYYCNPHNAVGMNGALTVQAAMSPPPSPPPSPPSGGKGSPGVGLVSIAIGVGLLAVALRRK